MKTYICQDILNLLPLYIEGKTSEETSYSIEKHLNDCDDCFNKYLALKEVSQRIKAAFASVSQNNFSNEKVFFKDNLSAFVDNELDKEDYYDFNQQTANNIDNRKELESMLLFEEKFQQSLEQNKITLNKDLSKDVVNEIKKNSPDYLYELYLKAASITVFLLITTVLTGYFSIPDNFHKISGIKNIFSAVLK